MSDSTDFLTLTVPNEPDYYGVLRLVVGGLAARLALGYEQLDNLQLAVESVLLERVPPGETVTLEASVGETAVVFELGPVDSHILGHDGAVGRDAISLHQLLGALVERAELAERDGEPWLRFEVGIPLRTGGGAT